MEAVEWEENEVFTVIFFSAPLVSYSKGLRGLWLFRGLSGSHGLFLCSQLSIICFLIHFEHTKDNGDMEIAGSGMLQ